MAGFSSPRGSRRCGAFRLTQLALSLMLGFVGVQLLAYAWLHAPERDAALRGGLDGEMLPLLGADPFADDERARREMASAFRERELLEAARRGPVKPPREAVVSATIPRLIHLSWIDARVPAAFAPNVLGWLRTHAPAALGEGGADEPWVLVFWSDAANDRLVETAYPQLLELYAAYSPIQRADFCRYLYMHALGGVYADLDFVPLRGLGALAARHGLVIGQEPPEHTVLLEHARRQLCNAILLSRPRHPFWAQLLARIGAYAAEEDAPGSTGPRMLEKEAQHYERRLGALERLRGPRRAAPAADAAGWSGAPCASAPCDPQPPQGPLQGLHGVHGLHVEPAATFYPLWDEMQRERLQQLCAPGEAGRMEAAGMRAEARVCAHLLATNFSNEVGPAALAVHTWSHVWLGEQGLSKVPLGDTYDLAQLGGPGALSAAERVARDTPPPPGAGSRAAARAAAAPPLRARDLAPLVLAPGALNETLAAISAARAAKRAELARDL